MTTKNDKKSRWLIVEDALSNRTGHWFEYVQTFYRGLRNIGDKVDILVAQDAEPFIVSALDAKPILPKSIWPRVNDSSDPIIRFLRIPYHALHTYRSVSRYLRCQPSAIREYDIVFVPTVLPHHLLGWHFLLKTQLRRSNTKFLFFFLSTPITYDKVTGRPTLEASPSGRLLRYLIRANAKNVESHRITLGTETRQLRDALTKATGVLFQYFPQPVELYVNESEHNYPITFGCYGAARHEKGSDILQQAILRFIESNPESRARFVIQWIDDFRDGSGCIVQKNLVLQKDSRVDFINRYFKDREYAEHLSKTDIILLPYRRSSYDLRGSRLAIDAMVNGRPVIVTKGIAPACQIHEFGSGIECDDGSAKSLGTAIREAEINASKLRENARKKMKTAREYFSVSQFKTMFGEYNKTRVT
jgi:glycosyltransferase involved in cell wall biosynthesis